MGDMGTKEAADRWNVTQATVSKWCRCDLTEYLTKRTF